MPENNMERPPESVTNNAKARWSVLKALRENPEGMTKNELVERVRDDWPNDFEGHRGRQAVGAALENSKRDELVWRDAEAKKWKQAENAEARQLEAEEESGHDEPTRQQREREWYQPVADALINLGLCTNAVNCGDDIKGPQWTNPDVVGLIKPPIVAHEYAHNFPAQLVAVEVKRATDAGSLLTGFAEACAYLDFAHFSWLIVPWCDNNDTIARVERLCESHGLGLAYVREETEEEEEVLWLEISIRPRCHNPDARQFARFLQRLTDRNFNI